MLGLDKAEAIELGLVSIGKKTKRIPESKRSLQYWKSKFALTVSWVQVSNTRLMKYLGSNGVLEAHLQCRRARSADRCEGGGADEGSNDSKSTEHFYC